MWSKKSGVSDVCVSPFTNVLTSSRLVAPKTQHSLRVRSMSVMWNSVTEENEMVCSEMADKGKKPKEIAALFSILHFTQMIPPQFLAFKRTAVSVMK